MGRITVITFGGWLMANKEVKIDIVGLGNVGSTFLRKLLEKKKQEIKVIAVAEKKVMHRG